MDGTLAEWKNVTSNYELYQQGYYESLRPNEHILMKLKDLLRKERMFLFFPLF